MNKIGFAFSNVLVIIGIVILMVIRIINSVLPKIGRAAYQIAAAGSYSPIDYRVDFTGISIVSIIIMVLGLAMAYFFYKAEKSS